MDLYPQLLQDPYLDAAISAQPIPEARESLRTIVAKTRQFEREKEVIVYDYATLEEAPPDRERAVERSEDHEAERTEGLEIITKQGGRSSHFDNASVNAILTIFSWCGVVRVKDRQRGSLFP